MLAIAALVLTLLVFIVARKALEYSADPIGLSAAGAGRAHARLGPARRDADASRPAVVAAWGYPQ